MFDALPPAPEGVEQADSAYASHAEPSFSLSGLVFADTVRFEAGGAAQTETDFSLAEIVASGRVGQVDLIASYDFARDGEWRDVGLSTNAGRFRFSLGQFKEPASLTKYTPQGGTVVMEASRYGSVFAIGRRMGLFARYNGERISIDAAVTDGSLDGSRSSGFGRGQRAALVRASTAVIEDDLTVHFGAYLRHLDYGGEGVVLKAGPHPALAPKTAKVSLTQAYGREARSSLLAGAEIGVSAGRWYAALDAGRMEIDTPAGDFVVTSAALEASVALTGERREYIPYKGAFKPVTPSTPLGDGGFGALELTVRADRIDFGDALGGETTSYTAGLTWTPRAGVRVLANFTTEAASRFAPESHTYAARLQIGF